MDTQPTMTVTSEGQSPSDKPRGHVSFRHVSFAYPSRPDVPVLSDFNLDILPNQTVALVGKSGAGKSTVLALLQRFYDVSEGSVCVDGVDVRLLDPLWLHRVIACVSQEPVLFSDSIRSNIRYSSYLLR